MCLGGGGGGDGGAAEREAARQRQIEEAIRGLNVQFGVNDYKEPDRNEFMMPGTTNEDGGQVPGVFDETAYNQALQGYQDNVARAGTNRQSRDALYGQTRSAVNDYYLDQLNQQRDTAGRQTKFSLARRGVRGGSSDLDVQGDMLRRYNEAVLNISNRADAAGTTLRSQDEQTRLGLIDRVNAGMSGSGAVGSAIEQLQTNADDVRANANAQSLGEVFGGYANYNQGEAAQRGRERAYGDYYGTYYNPRSYSGRRTT